ncbi:MAG TPA: hypothetical protein VK565_00945, partial [Gemmatimonadaceae bacterium]|nr:hypothetical protein [Gemmatimonadaceae bacterium]
DQTGAVMAGVSVTFAVTAGGGSVTGSTVASSPAGVATVGSWTVGTAEGVNTVTATSGTLSLAFTANSVDPCVIGATHSIGGTTNGELTASDCRFPDGSFVDLIGTVLSTAGTYTFSQSSSGFDTFLVLFDVNGNPIGVNDDFAAGSDSRIKAVLPAGNFVLAANSHDADVLGPYTLTSALDASEVTNCENVFVVRGITTTQTLQASDCQRTGGYYGDQFFIYVVPGQPVTVSMSSAAVDSYIAIYDTRGAVLIFNDDKDGTTKDAQVAFTPSVEGFYGILASSGNVGATGSYTVVVQ